jgi:DHA2 family multidrug resistance protein
LKRPLALPICSFFSVPMERVASGTKTMPVPAPLKNEQIGNASGLFNLMRNVGGGIGISMVNTLVARHQQIHRSQLVQNLAHGNSVFQQVFDANRGLMSQYVGPVVADQRAYGLIQNTLERQSAAYSYVDVFRYLAIACFVCAFIVIFMKRVQARKGAPVMAH